MRRHAGARRGGPGRRARRRLPGRRARRRRAPRPRRPGARRISCCDRSRRPAPSCWPTRPPSANARGGHPGPRRHGLHLGGAAAPPPQAGPCCTRTTFGTPAAPQRRPAAADACRPPIGAHADDRHRSHAPRRRRAHRPRGAGRLRHAAADPVAVDALRGRLGEGGRAGRAGPHRPGGRRGGLLLSRRVRPHRHPAPPGRRHGHHLVRHDGDAGLAGRGHDAHPPALPRADPRPAPSAARGQGALDDRPPLGRAPHRRRRRRPRARGVRAADRRLRRSGAATPTRPSPRLAAAFTDEFPELPGPRFPARDMGIAPRPVRQPRPPIWIGGSSPAAIRRTAAFGDGWLPQGTAGATCRARSPGCASCATSSAAARRSTSAPSSSPST